MILSTADTEEYNSLERLQSFAWWPGMKKDLEHYISVCGPCQRNNISKTGESEMFLFEIGGAFEDIYMDTLGGLPISYRGNKYLLVVIDSFTRYVILIPVPDKSAYTICHAYLYKAIANFGVPLTIHTDGGTEYCNDFNKCMQEMLGIQNIHTTSAHPAGNGLVERVNREIILLIKKMVPNQKKWDEVIPFIQLILNSYRRRGIEISPQMAMTGREAFTDLQNQLGLKPRHSEIAEWNSTLTRCRQHIKAAQGQVDLAMKERRDGNVDTRQSHFKIGKKSGQFFLI